MKKKEASFEEGLARLEELVASLEGRSLGLDQALAAFEEGLKLSAGLRKKLDEAAGKLEILTRGADGRPSAKLFDLDGVIDSEEAADDEDEDEDQD